MKNVERLSELDDVIALIKCDIEDLVRQCYNESDQELSVGAW